MGLFTAVPTKCSLRRPCRRNADCICTGVKSISSRLTNILLWKNMSICGVGVSPDYEERGAHCNTNPLRTRAGYLSSVRCRSCNEDDNPLDASTSPASRVSHQICPAMQLNLRYQRYPNLTRAELCFSSLGLPRFEKAKHS